MAEPEFIDHRDTVFGLLVDDQMVKDRDFFRRHLGVKHFIRPATEADQPILDGVPWRRAHVIVELIADGARMRHGILSGGGPPYEAEPLPDWFTIFSGDEIERFKENVREHYEGGHDHV